MISTEPAPAPAPGSPIRIAHVIPGLQVAGAENALLKLVQASDPQVCRHLVVSLSTRTDLLPMFRAAGTDVLELSFSSPVRAARSMVRLRQALARFAPDVIQGWLVHGNLFAWLSRSSSPGARLAWNFRGSAHETLRKRSTDLLTRWLGRIAGRVDLLISNSQAALDEHRELGYRGEIEVVIPNGFDLARFQAPETAAAVEQFGSGTVFAMVGRVHPVKGHDVFIEAAKQLAKRKHDATFVLIGEGTKALSLGPDAAGAPPLFALGRRNDIPELLRSIDVLCLPSRHEGFPNVVGEAMAAGVPVIASDISDMRSIVGNAGLLVPAGDAEALTDAMETMIGMGPEARREMGRLGRRIVEERYQLSVVSRLFEQTYARTLAGRWSAARQADA